MSEELKTCPFCGSTPVLRHPFNDKLALGCENQKCRVRPDTWMHVQTEVLSDVVRAWNQRETV